jgi:hypothetical protein
LAIRRIGFRIDESALTVPLKGAFLFEGAFASAEVCKNGGWQSLSRPDGTDFRNQGDCIQFATTGV